MRTPLFSLLPFTPLILAGMIPMKDSTTIIHTTITIPVAQHTPIQHPSPAVTTHTVIVGGPSGLIFEPSQLHAAVGDTVHFVFLSRNHTLTQSTFDAPCVKKEGGVDSGFVPTDKETLEGAPGFTVTVETEEPTWWYCKQKQPRNHCTEGMVFALNPTTEKTFDRFLENAISSSPNSTSPSESFASHTTIPAATHTQTQTPAATSSAAQWDYGNNNSSTGMEPGTGLVKGWNRNANPEACNCACLCGASGFPAGDGVGAFGGWGGAMPAPW
ncbi:hypothetical protein EX30DRAFT_57946 [Ascodesmis nigricans]|uniref:Cupredoxin n=1 Tax=Ascodesmis nigricans TaxID=341454 RepID=A0A4V3SIJ8_9PEZI|nr:hypothetical protein EX30DRAFT_57946 [Ascodesmis nigricans]